IIKINSSFPFVYITPSYIDIPFKTWNNTSIAYYNPNFRLPRLIIRDIVLDSFIMQRKEFNKIYPTIDKLELYFTDIRSVYSQNIANNSSSTVSSNLNIDLEDIANLFAFAATSFFEAINIRFNVPFFYSFDDLYKNFLNLRHSSSSKLPSFKKT